MKRKSSDVIIKMNMTIVGAKNDVAGMNFKLSSTG
jgi:hypothetical protein